MLTSINPLGERVRDSKWLRTVSAFSLAAVAGGALLGTILGMAGGTVLGRPLWAPVAIGLILAAGADLSGAPVAGLRRQVDETWIGSYRDWVYGAGFGMQLGLGFVTFVVSWGTWAIALGMLLSADPNTGAVVGGVFGLGRAMTLWTSGAIQHPSQLATHARAMARLAGPIRRITVLMLIILGGVMAWSS